MYAATSIEVGTTISPQAIIANTLLQMTSEELEQAISREAAENPALEEVPSPPFAPLATPP